MQHEDTLPRRFLESGNLLLSLPNLNLDHEQYSPEVLDLVAKMLPAANLRITVAQALEHPWFAEK